MSIRTVVVFIGFGLPQTLVNPTRGSKASMGPPHSGAKGATSGGHCSASMGSA